MVKILMSSSCAVNSEKYNTRVARAFMNLKESAADDSLHQCTVTAPVSRRAGESQAMALMRDLSSTDSMVKVWGRSCPKLKDILALKTEETARFQDRTVVVGNDTIAGLEHAFGGNGKDQYPLGLVGMNEDASVTSCFDTADVQTENWIFLDTHSGEKTPEEHEAVFGVLDNLFTYCQTVGIRPVVIGINEHEPFATVDFASYVKEAWPKCISAGCLRDLLVQDNAESITNKKFSEKKSYERIA